MSTARNTLDPLRRFRLMVVRITMVITMVIAAIAFKFDPVFAQGVLLGGIASTLGFWIIAVRLEKVAREKPSKVQFAALTWSFYRYGLYGLVLYKAFKLDPVSYHGLLGALVGIFIIRFVLYYIAISGRDQKTESGSSHEDDTRDEEKDPDHLDNTDG